MGPETSNIGYLDPLGLSWIDTGSLWSMGDRGAAPRAARAGHRRQDGFSAFLHRPQEGYGSDAGQDVERRGLSNDEGEDAVHRCIRQPGPTGRA